MISEPVAIIRPGLVRRRSPALRIVSQFAKAQSFLRTSMRSAEHSLRTCARHRRDGNTKGAREGTGFTTATGRDRFWRSSEQVDRLAAQFVGAIGGCVVIVETTDDAHALALQRFSPGVRR